MLRDKIFYFTVNPVGKKCIISSAVYVLFANPATIISFHFSSNISPTLANSFPFIMICHSLYPG